MFVTSVPISPDEGLRQLRSRIAATYDSNERLRVERALDFIAAAPQVAAKDEVLLRASAIAEVLLELEVDPDTITAALVSTGSPAAELNEEWAGKAFGSGVMALIHGIRRAGQIEMLNRQHAATAEQPGIETLRKMLLAMADDVRVVLIKLAERTVFMREMTRADDAARRAAAMQTRDLFAPLANRLGVFQIKWELEDLSFRFLEPELYKRIASLLDGKRGEREEYIRGVIAVLRGELKKLGLDAQISGRPKHIWSIHRKMQAKHLAFEKLYDIRAVRVLVDRVSDCYAVLGVVHDLWQPVPGEFDDYIAQPKANDYRSLHTAVLGPEGKTLEVQIRTHEMHQASEHGVAAHWRYKEAGGVKADRKFEARIAWLRQVLEWREELADAGGFSEQVKKGLFNDTVYVLTPQGRVIDLPAGATPVDFAYHVHTDLGHRCRGAKVDGNIVPLNTALQNGQYVEILAAKQGGPSRDWLSPQLGYLHSPRAMAKVRTWFKQEYFEVDVAHGRQTLERELQRAGATALALEKIATPMGYREVDEFLAAIGRGDMTPHQIEVALRDLHSPQQALPVDTTVLPVAADARTGKSSAGVLVLGVNNIATLVAKCCKPVPPDTIVGFVTRNRGVTVHRHNCPNITGLAPDQRERLMPAEWGHTGEVPFSVDIDVLAGDRQGLLRDVSDALAHERINVTAVNTQSRANLASMRFTVEVRQGEHLQRVLRAISEVPGVEQVHRR